MARRLLASVPPLVAGAGRMGFGLVVLVGYLAVTGRLGLVAQLGPVQWAWVLGTGVLLAGYVATWYGALQRAPAATVAAVLTLGAPITAGLSAVVNGGVPAAGPLGGYLLMLLAAGGLARRLAAQPDADGAGDRLMLAAPVAPAVAALRPGRCSSGATPSARIGSATAARTRPRRCSPWPRPGPMTAGCAAWPAASRAPTRTWS